MKFSVDVPGIPEPTRELRGLVSLLFDAHYRSAIENSNVSSVAVQNCNLGNPGTLSGIASAILTMGATHAPVIDALKVWRMGNEELQLAVTRGVCIPGFGNSFYKAGDPKWDLVARWLERDFPNTHKRLTAKTAIMLMHAPSLFPNAAMYTAIVADLLGVPEGQEPLLVLLPRLPAWFEL